MGDDDVGAVRPADAASLVVLEETDSNGAADVDVAVVTPVESHHSALFKCAYIRLNLHVLKLIGVVLN